MLLDEGASGNWSPFSYLTFEGSWSSSFPILQDISHGQTMHQCSLALLASQRPRLTLGL